MLPLYDQLSHRDQVLVALILKNSELGDEVVNRVIEQFNVKPEDSTDLAHFFVELGHFTRTEMYQLVKARNFALLRREDKRVGRRAVRKGYITRSEVNKELDFQKQLFKALGDIKRLHDILLEEGKLSVEQVNEVWSEYREFLRRRGEKPEEARTDPNLLKRRG